jgi:hypothetical protein
MAFLMRNYLRFVKKAGILSIVPFLSFLPAFNNNIYDNNITMIIDQILIIVIIILAIKYGSFSEIRFQSHL